MLRRGSFRWLLLSIDSLIPLCVCACIMSDCVCVYVCSEYLSACLQICLLLNEYVCVAVKVSHPLLCIIHSYNNVSACMLISLSTCTYDLFTIKLIIMTSSHHLISKQHSQSQSEQREIATKHHLFLIEEELLNKQKVQLFR